MPWKGVDHVHGISKDEGKSIKFYTEVMGFDFVKRLEHVDGRDLLEFTDGSGTKMFLFQIEEDEPHPLIPKQQAPPSSEAYQELEGKDPTEMPLELGWHHVAWHVGTIEDLNTVKRRLEEHGIPHWGPIRRNPGTFNIYFEDPNGINLEVGLKNADDEKAREELIDWSSGYDPLEEPSITEGMLKEGTGFVKEVS